jgi:hypothetical protein
MIDSSGKARRGVFGISLHGWEQLMLFSLLLVFATTAAVVILQRREASEARHELAEYKLTVEGKVADAKKEGIEAGKAAGNALLRAADLEKQAGQLRKDAAEANAALGVAQADIAKADAEIAQANERAATARLETERLKQTFSWRLLSAEHTSKLTAVLSTRKGRVNLRYTDGDPEALTLASQFAAIFAKVEWQVAQAPFKAENGVMFGIYLPDSNGDDARTLRSALRAADIPFSPEALPLAPVVRLRVGIFPDAPTIMFGTKLPKLP